MPQDTAENSPFTDAEEELFNLGADAVTEVVMIGSLLTAGKTVVIAPDNKLGKRIVELFDRIRSRLPAGD